MTEFKTRKRDYKLYEKAIYRNMNGTIISLNNYFDNICNVVEGHNAFWELFNNISPDFSYNHSDEIRISPAFKVTKGNIVLLYKIEANMPGYPSSSNLLEYIENTNKSSIEYCMTSSHYYGGMNSKDEYLYLYFRDWNRLGEWHTDNYDNINDDIFINFISEETLKIIAYTDLEGNLIYKNRITC